MSAVSRIHAATVIAALALALVLAAGAFAAPSGPAPAPSGTPPGNRTTGDVTVLSEDFEGAWPGAWTATDRNPANGLDYWGPSTYRAFTGAHSAWSAEVGSQPAGVPVTVWTEDFEGVAWPADWTATDRDPASGLDYWGVSAYRAFSGGASAWVAEVGDSSTTGQPNNVLHQYDNNMDAHMSRDPGLTGYAFGIMTFAYYVNSQAGVDVLNVGYDDPAYGWVNKTYSGFTGWTTDAIPVPATAVAVDFWFLSDGATVSEGAYVDDITMMGLRGTPVFSDSFEGAWPGAWTVGDSDARNGQDYWGPSTYRSMGGSTSAWVAEVGDNAALGGQPNTAVRRYDNYMTSTMDMPITLTDNAFLTFWYWLASETCCDEFRAGYFDPAAGGWQYAVTQRGFPSGWQAAGFAVPATATMIRFDFFSDFSIVYEGVYVDTVDLYTLSGVSNEQARLYDNNMDAILSHPVDLAGFTSAWMTYAYWLEVESPIDGLGAVYSVDGVTWNLLAAHTADTAGWATDNVTVPTTAQYVGFEFYSDGSIVYEGAYVDDVHVVGTAPDLTCNATVAPTAGTEQATQFNFTGTGGAGVPPYNYSWALGGAGSSFAQSPTYVYPVGGVFTPTLTVTDDVGQVCVARTPQVTVSHVGPISVSVTASPSTVPEGTSRTVTAVVRDYYGHDLASVATVAWSVQPSTCGTISGVGATASFAADGDAGGTDCTVTANANAAGFAGSGNGVVHVVHAGPVTVTVTPGTGAVDEGGSLSLTAVVRDAHGHDVTADATLAWTIAPGSTCAGTFSAAAGATTAFAATRSGTCTLVATATWGSDTADGTSVVTVRANVLMQVLPYLVIAIVVALLLAVLLVMRRRKRKAPTFQQMQTMPAEGVAGMPPQGPPEMPPQPPPPQAPPPGA